jgi:hypothetical protein
MAPHRRCPSLQCRDDVVVETFEGVALRFGAHNAGPAEGPAFVRAGSVDLDGHLGLLGLLAFGGWPLLSPLGPFTQSSCGTCSVEPVRNTR